jgi:hypothetical protein
MKKMKRFDDTFALADFLKKSSCSYGRIELQTDVKEVDLFWLDAERFCLWFYANTIAVHLTM